MVNSCHGNAKERLLEFNSDKTTQSSTCSGIEGDTSYLHLDVGTIINLGKMITGYIDG